MHHLPLLAVLLAVPASAQELELPVLSGFFFDAIMGSVDSYGPLETRTAPRVGLIQTGDLDITLEVTPVMHLMLAYGGLIHEIGDGTGRTWSCYGLPDGTVWFGADGGLADGKIIAVGAQDGVPDPYWGCTFAPFRLRYLQLDLPGTRITAEELAATFGEFTADPAGGIGFSSQSPHPDKPGVINRQDYLYRFGANGKVDAVAVLQTTSD
jgi:hypothetical protein